MSRELRDTCKQDALADAPRKASGKRESHAEGQRPARARGRRRLQRGVGPRAPTELARGPWPLR